MTRAEDEEVRSYYNRKYYLNRREAVIAYQKKYRIPQLFRLPVP